MPHAVTTKMASLATAEKWRRPDIAPRYGRRCRYAGKQDDAAPSSKAMRRERECRERYAAKIEIEIEIEIEIRYRNIEIVEINRRAEIMPMPQLYRR